MQTDERTMMNEESSLKPPHGFAAHLVPKLSSLPGGLPLEGAVRIELEEGIPIFRASRTAQARIKKLLLKERQAQLSAQEKQELDQWEEVDGYLSFVNRVIRNLMQAQDGEGK